MSKLTIPISSSEHKKLPQNPKGRPKVSPSGRKALQINMRLSPEARDILSKLPSGAKTHFVNRAILLLWSKESGSAISKP